MAKLMPTQIEEAIRLHSKWRRQFFNAFAGGNYAEMPLSEHRSCLLAGALEAHNASPDLIALHLRFHSLANEITTLSQNGMGDAADLLLPELSETTHQLATQLDQLR
ncbi:MAG: hypothetical protein RBT53_01185 [Azonexus sp.]|nr:hypothetical protein [Azonexus sp.]